MHQRLFDQKQVLHDSRQSVRTYLVVSYNNLQLLQTGQ
jgi:hypothetical protein